MKITARLESTMNKLSHEYDWFVLTDHPDATDMGNGVSGFFPDSSGDSSLKACETWLANRGFKQIAEMAPECFEYVCESHRFVVSEINYKHPGISSSRYLTNKATIVARDVSDVPALFAKKIGFSESSVVRWFETVFKIGDSEYSISPAK